MFSTFRDEMDKVGGDYVGLVCVCFFSEQVDVLTLKPLFDMQMAKHTKKLEKENTVMKKKCAEYDNNAISTIQDKVKAAEETQKYLEKIKKLESLCRHLQAERNSIREGKQPIPESG